MDVQIDAERGRLSTNNHFAVSSAFIVAGIYWRHISASKVRKLYFKTHLLCKKSEDDLPV